MAGLNEILLALALTGGGHEMGHQVEADKLNQPMDWQETNWTTPASGEDLARISGAGFEMQDTLNQATGSSVMGKINALHKLSYAALDRGDLSSIEKSKGKTARKVAQGSLVASAISDLLRKPGSNYGLKYGQSSKGTPMFVLGGRF